MLAWVGLTESPLSSKKSSLNVPASNVTERSDNCDNVWRHLFNATQTICAHNHNKCQKCSRCLPPTATILPSRTLAHCFTASGLPPMLPVARCFASRGVTLKLYSRLKSQVPFRAQQPWRQLARHRLCVRYWRTESIPKQYC